MSRRIVMHLDMDAFFASVEQNDNPELKGLPVVVGTGQRSVVSAASYEARKFGIRSAMPVAQARKLCPQAVFLPVRMRRYSEVSKNIMRILQDFSPQIEQASVDEAYIDASGLDGLFGPPPDMARRIKTAIREGTGLSCSVGIAPNKFLAKIASDMNKPDGLTVILEEDVPTFVAGLPIERIPGVGARSAETLHKLGVSKAGDVLRFTRDFWIERLGERGGWLYRRAQGLDDSPVEPWGEAKSSSAENTLEQDTSDKEALTNWLALQAERVGLDLRRHGYKGRTVTLKVKYADFKSLTRSHTLPAATNTTRTIFEVATSLLQALKLTGKVRLIGLGVSNFARGGEQLSLLDDTQDKREAKLDSALDAIRDKFGSKAISRGRVFDFRKK